MSEAWTRFETQLHATGREKADGYAADHFDGMTEEEKRRAFDLLAAELLYDPSVAKWLFQLDPARAQTVSRDVLARKRGDPYFPAFDLEYSLYVHAQDPNERQRLQQQMIDGYPEVRPEHKLRALRRLGQTAFTPALRALLEDRLLHETDSDLVGTAAYDLMVGYGMPYNTDEDKARFRERLSQLMSPTLETRRQALQMLKP